MRKYLLLICLVFLLASCREEENSVKVTRIIKNETNKEIKLLVYDEEFLVEEFLISEQSSDTLESNCSFVRGTLQSCPPVWSLENDSVKLIFNQERELLYCLIKSNCSLINGKNILNLSITPTPEISQNGYVEVSDNVFVFTIEESDYQLAKPL